MNFFLFERRQGGRLHTSEMALEFNESNVFPVAVCAFHRAANEIFLKIERQLLILFCFFYYYYFHSLILECTAG